MLEKRWTILILLELADAPQRFSALRRAIPGMSANLLARRLKELEAASVITRAQLPPPASVAVYAIMPPRASLAPILRDLRSWLASDAERSMQER